MPGPKLTKLLLEYNILWVGAPVARKFPSRIQTRGRPTPNYSHTQYSELIVVQVV